VDDLIVGVPRTLGSGSLYVVPGPTTGTSTLAGAVEFQSDAPLDAMGKTAVGPFDLNGDGGDDLVAPASQAGVAASDRGAVFVAFGPITGSIGSEDADVVWTGDAVGDLLGYAATRMEDIDGAGNPALLLGAYDADVGFTGAGAAYMVIGSLPGTYPVSDVAEATISGPSTESYAGFSVASLDQDADGRSDAVVGAPFAEWEDTAGGAVFVVPSPVSGDIALPSGADGLYGDQDGAYVGDSVASLGDIDGDGNDDLAVGADEWTSSTQSGAVFVLMGPIATGDIAGLATATIYGKSDGDSFGYSVAGPGDVTGDGVPDALVGAYKAGGTGSPPGAAFLFAGPLSGTMTTTDATSAMQGEGGDDEAGYAVAGAGDLDGNGVADILVGAPDEGPSTTLHEGAAYVLLGGGP